MTRPFGAAAAVAAALAAISAGAGADAAGFDPYKSFRTQWPTAYQSFVASLPAPARKVGWLARQDDIASPNQMLQVAGKPRIYVFACKSHACDTDQVHIFITPDQKQVASVVRIGGVQRLLGGAGPVELACVRKLDASGGQAASC